MRRSRRPSRSAPLWVFALALLLRAAMPFLATLSADVQGRALAEVCSVHGVALVSSHEAGRQDTPAPDPARHAGDPHCMLSVLAALGAPCTLPQAVARRQATVAATPSASVAPARPDAAATWVARRKQGPPGVA